MTTENPFAAPQAAGNQQDDHGLDSKSRRAIRIGEEVVLWEKLRLLYNAILTVVTLVCFIIRPEWFDNWLATISVIAFGFIGANLCYSAGTVVGAYLAWAGFRSQSITVFLFVIGTVVAILLTALTMIRTTF